jgi:hypothetical protein
MGIEKIFILYDGDTAGREAAKKIKENDPYNPSGSGPARLPSEPSASDQKMNIADDKKHSKGCTCDECSMKPGYVKTNRTYEEKK